MATAWLWCAHTIPSVQQFKSIGVRPQQCIAGIACHSNVARTGSYYSFTVGQDHDEVFSFNKNNNIFRHNFKNQSKYLRILKLFF